MTRNEDLDSYQDAYQPDFKFDSENLSTLDWYSRRMCHDMRTLGTQSVLSLGIGHRVVSQNIEKEFSENLSSHTILEGSKEIIENYKAKYGKHQNVDIIHTYFEEFETEQRFDAIEAGFVMEHVDDPHEVLGHIKKFVVPGGKIYLAVPNATSLHRQIGNKAGLLDDMYKLSEYDLQLGHKRYFDVESFKQLAKDCGLQIVKVEGIYLKPVTTSQIESLELTDDVMRALYEMGLAYPELCNSIYMETVA